MSAQPYQIIHISVTGETRSSLLAALSADCSGRSYICGIMLSCTERQLSEKMSAVLFPFTAFYTLYYIALIIFCQGVCTDSHRNQILSIINFNHQRTPQHIAVILKIDFSLRTRSASRPAGNNKFVGSCRRGELRSPAYLVFVIK